MKKVLIHYFSGTGNTYHAVKIIGNNFEQQGYNVNYLYIENETAPKNISNLNDYHLHIFAYPVYGLGTPSIVLKYLKKLKSVQNCYASILNIGGCTYKSQGFEGQTLSHVSVLLRKKGFNVFYSDFIAYPENWTQLINPLSKEFQQKVFRESDSKINNSSYKMMNLEVNKKENNLFILLLSWIVFFCYSIIGRKILGKIYISDNTCTSCGLCIKACPTKMIKLGKGSVSWGWECEGCQRCINICPNKAIQTSILKLIIYATIEIVPIFILIKLNNNWNMNWFVNILLNIFLYGISFIVFHYFVDKLIFLLEKIPKIKRLFEFSYTKRYRRYFVNEFEPTKQ